MSARTSRRSAVRLFAYPAGRTTGPGHEAIAVDGSLALTPGHAPSTGPPRRPRTGGPPTASARARSALRSVRQRDGGPDDGLATAAEVIIRLALEAFAGRRPFHHLARWVTLRVAEELSCHRPPAPATGRVSPPRILSSWIQTPAADHAEVGAVALLGGEVQAIALRLERFRGRWRCRALETTMRRR
ncbi:Rv3235 family protein [Actinomadura sp. HBU206391]|uniref:Rv3235 family protein n=1 Tax=Actinomadura sp. HBU206391 TaxID=2731692 RepID=UPI001650CCC0|nr:Rv3235 family protein [Actinomadura sp. HBU206391]MBC6456787.1 hypothetical protein [Actinomadura sp. HBU206391]